MRFESSAPFFGDMSHFHTRSQILSKWSTFRFSLFFLSFWPFSFKCVTSTELRIFNFVRNARKRKEFDNLWSALKKNLSHVQMLYICAYSSHLLFCILNWLNLHTLVFSYKFSHFLTNYAKCFLRLSDCIKISIIAIFYGYTLYNVSIPCCKMNIHEALMKTEEKMYFTSSYFFLK